MLPIHAGWAVSGVLYLLGGLVKALREHFAAFAFLVSTSTGGAAASAASALTSSRVVTAIAGILVAGTTALVVAAARKLVDAVANRADALFREFESMQAAIVRIDGTLGRLAGVVDHHQRFEERTESRIDAAEVAIAELRGRISG